MAGWQCRFCIIPKHTANQYDQTNEPEVLLWKKDEIPIDKFKSLENYIPIEKSWASYITQYGNLQETCIEVINLPDNEVEISVRLDLTKLNESMYKIVLDLIINCECRLFVGSTDKIYDGNEESLKQLIKESAAYRLGKKYNSFIASL